MLRRGTVVLLLVGFLAVAAVGGAMAWLHGGFGGGDRGSAERGEGYAGESASDDAPLRYDVEYPPMHYATAPHTDPIAKLEARLESGAVA